MEFIDLWASVNCSSTIKEQCDIPDSWIDNCWLLAKISKMYNWRSLKTAIWNVLRFNQV